MVVAACVRAVRCIAQERLDKPIVRGLPNLWPSRFARVEVGAPTGASQSSTKGSGRGHGIARGLDASYCGGR